MNPALDALLNDDPNGFKEAIDAILMDKLADRIEVERADAAADLFGGGDQEELEYEQEPEETDDTGYEEEGSDDV